MLTVKDIMTRPVIVIRSAATVANAMWMMRANRVRSLIVEKIAPDISYGILTEKDIVYNVIAPGKNPGFVRVSDIMRYPCIYVSPTVTVQEAAQCLSDAGIHRAPVIQANELLGIVSVTDILDKGSLPAPPHDELSRRIRDALQHTRIVDDPDAKIQQECDIAWQVLEDMRQNATVNV
ncbi:MAG: CBS domain-containing protein [Phormidesmis sp. RL_2_1]|nr:CBS domain-containing protein [Phormidesmis sp. RL_2_1]